jgi:hypothetical protein
VTNNHQIVSKTVGDEGDAPLDQWVGTFERYWQHLFLRVKELAETTILNGEPL